MSDPPKEPEHENDPKRAKRLRDEDVGNQAPHLTVANARGIEIENGDVLRVEKNEDKDERIKCDDIPEKSWDREEPQPLFQLIYPGHVRGQ